MAANCSTELPRVEVPGLSEARRRERAIRESAFIDVPHWICDIPVRAFTLRHLLILDQLKNGFIVPCEYERPSERVAHALQFIWVCSAWYTVPTSYLQLLWMRYQRWKFIRHAERLPALAVFASIEAYQADAFYDGPKMMPGEPTGISYFCYIVGIVDALYAAGYPWSEQQILDMPLARLWQYHSLAQHRRFPDVPLSNPSDRVAVEFIQKGVVAS